MFTKATGSVYQANLKSAKAKNAATIQFPVDAALFYLTHCFRASDNKPEPLHKISLLVQ